MSATTKVGKNPESVILPGNGKHALVVNEGSGSISLINTSTGATVDTVQVGGQPSPAALSPDQTVFAVLDLPGALFTVAFGHIAYYHLGKDILTVVAGW